MWEVSLVKERSVSAGGRDKDRVCTRPDACTEVQDILKLNHVALRAKGRPYKEKTSLNWVLFLSASHLDQQLASR